MSPALYGKITFRQFQVIGLVCCGMGPVKIAKAMGSPVSSAKRQLHLLYNLTGAESLTHLFRIAVEHESMLQDAQHALLIHDPAVPLDGWSSRKLLEEMRKIRRTSLLGA